MITVTVEKVDGVAISGNTKFKIDRDMLARPPQPLTADTVSSKCRLWIKMDVGGPIVQEWLTTETFAAVTDAITNDTVLSGAQSTATKDTSGGYVGLTLLKINFLNALATFTSFFTNANTAARTYTFPDVTGTVAVGAKIATGALVAGVRTISDASVTTSSVAFVQKRALGGTYAPGYKVVCTAGSVTITALQSDGTTTETANTDSVMGYIIY